MAFKNMTLRIKTLSITMLNMAIKNTTLSIMTFDITMPSIPIKYDTQDKDNQQNDI